DEEMKYAILRPKSCTKKQTSVDHTTTNIDHNVESRPANTHKTAQLVHKIKRQREGSINKFTKKLRNPHYIDNNEVLDYLSRIPCDKELREWREFKVTPSANGREKEKKPK
ncbi:hypothetical protein ANCDUO_11422, partial [Ancylostoma duodenale]